MAEKFGLKSRADPPSVTVAAPTPFWRRWRDHKSAAHWIPAVAELTREVGESLGVRVRFVDLGPVGVTPGAAGEPPIVTGQLRPSLLVL